MTSGSSRQSSRGGASRMGRAASASFSAAGENTCGIWCVASAMRLTARSDLTEPIVSTTRAEGGPNRPSRRGSTATRSPSRASPAMPAGTKKSRARASLLDRKRTARAVGRNAIDGEGARLDLVEDLDHPARIGGRRRPGVGIELDSASRPAPPSRAPARCRACRGNDAREFEEAGRPRSIRRAWR